MKSKRTLLIVVATMLAVSACSYSEEERPQSPPASVVPVPQREPLNVAPAPAVLQGPAPTIDAVSLKKRIDVGEKTTIVCVRSADTEPVIKGAVKVDEDSIVTWAEKLKKDAFLAVYCTCNEDQASNRAVHQLRENGYENAFVIEHGLKAWTAAGGAVTGGVPPKAPAAVPPKAPAKAK
jgi:rhodanese-related sulfurtransferase